MSSSTHQIMTMTIITTMITITTIIHTQTV